MGVEPMRTGFADLRVNHFATDAFKAGVRDQGLGVRVIHPTEASQIFC